LFFSKNERKISTPIGHGKNPNFQVGFLEEFDYLTDEISLKSTNPLKLGQFNRQITNSS
jgi:hypothetical protein